MVDRPIDWDYQGLRLKKGVYTAACEGPKFTECFAGKRCMYNSKQVESRVAKLSPCLPDSGRTNKVSLSLQTLSLLCQSAFRQKKSHMPTILQSISRKVLGKQIAE